MKKKILISVIIFALLLVFFLPVPQGKYDDGGTRVYAALTYKVVKWNKRLMVVGADGQAHNNTYRKTSVYWFPHNQKTIDQLWQLEWANK